MSGHSKWATTKHQKAAKDSRRGKLFAKLIRQVDSFEADLDVAGLHGGSFPAVFIRAPQVERVGEGVEVLASVATPSGEEGERSTVVLCRQGPVTVAAFHPELSGDLRIHQQFLSS